MSVLNMLRRLARYEILTPIAVLLAAPAMGQVINVPTTDVVVTGPSFVNNSDITGTPIAVDSTAAVDSIVNSVGATVTGVRGFSIDDTVGTFSNAGTISTSGNAISGFGGYGSFNNSGTISGSVGLSTYGTVGSFSNSGTIRGTSNDALYFMAAIDRFANSGLIENDSASDATIYFNGSATVASFSNSGTIRNTGGGSAITFSQPAAGGSFANSGTIAGSIGIEFANAGDRRISNAGTIRGTGGTAISFFTGDDQLTLLTGSRLEGAVDFQAGADTLDASGFSGVAVIDVLGLETFVAGNRVSFSDLDNAGDGKVAIVDVGGSGTTGATTSSAIGAVLGAVTGALDGTGAIPTPTEPSAYAPTRSNAAAHAAETAVLSELSVAPARAQLWGQVIGGSSRDDAPVAVSNVFGGIVAGSHAQLDADTRLGGFAGAVTGNTAIAGGQTISTQTGLIGVYGRTDLGTVILDYALAGGASANSSRRDAAIGGGTETLTASYGSWFIAPSASLTLPVLADDLSEVNIKASASYLYGGVSAYTETSPSMTVAIGAAPISIFTAALELNGSHVVGQTEHGSIRLRGSASVFAEANMGTGAVPVSITTAGLSGSSTTSTPGTTTFGAVLGSGFSADIAENLALDFGADVSLRNDGLTATTGKASLIGSF